MKHTNTHTLKHIHSKCTDVGKLGTLAYLFCYTVQQSSKAWCVEAVRRRKVSPAKERFEFRSKEHTHWPPSPSLGCLENNIVSNKLVHVAQ